MNLTSSLEHISQYSVDVVLAKKSSSSISCLCTDSRTKLIFSSVTRQPWIRILKKGKQTKKTSDLSFTDLNNCKAKRFKAVKLTKENFWFFPLFESVTHKFIYSSNRSPSVNNLKKVKSVLEPATYPGFYGMKHLGVLPLPCGWDAIPLSRRLHPYQATLI